MINDNKHNDKQIDKLITGIPGFEWISEGGLPKNRTTLIAGSSGSAKTIFSVQFLVEGILQFDEKAVFVTFEESPEEIKRNMMSFGWNVEKWEKEDKWIFVDASNQPEAEYALNGEYDLGGLITRIEYAINKIKATRISFDSIGAIYTQLTSKNIVRKELFRLVYALRKMQVTSIITMERVEEYGPIARFDVEEFVVDSVIILRNILEEEKRRRTIEILKFRGTTHQKGEYPFTIVHKEGITIIPLSATDLTQSSSNLRITSGSKELDEMCDGGFYRDSIVLISGATGTGKTLLVTQFMAGGVEAGEKCLLFSFEESREQLFRNATGWGFDFYKMEQEGKIKIICVYPETAGLEDHLVKIKHEIDEFEPNRIAVDSFTALEHVSPVKSFRQFVLALTSFIKQKEVAGLFTSTTPTLLGGTSLTEAHISTITDSIILLRYVELYGETRRGITVLKMRGSMHDKHIREFFINSTGIHIKKAFRGVAGILGGNPTQISLNDMDRINQIFQTEE